ncbi:MAG: hypothetical protein LBT89_07515 [Planctomycetaceae bacterium]|jgi:hypothetical protein|nr:hypothetical protein [Planctomycetaceae bacterium]
MPFWNIETEKQFFRDALRMSSPESLFYNLSLGQFAYVPQKQDAEGQTLQSRNSLIGSFTERWAKNLFEPLARKHNLFAVNGVQCDAIGLPRGSKADLAFCTTNDTIQSPENIKLVFEIKMSIVSNYRFQAPNSIEWVGDYKSHKGQPSLLRSDSMLKAIGKSINIRVSSVESATIPIIILGNSPITQGYVHKVDFLKTSGVVQGFWSLHPNPIPSDFVVATDGGGFQTISNLTMLEKVITPLLANDMNYFSSMVTKRKLGEIIRIASSEPTDTAKAEKFLSLIRSL